MRTIMAGLAEFKRDLIRERVKVGLAGRSMTCTGRLYPELAHSRASSVRRKYQSR
jgi:hypothetical protein